MGLVFSLLSANKKTKLIATEEESLSLFEYWASMTCLKRVLWRIAEDFCETKTLCIVQWETGFVLAKKKKEAREEKKWSWFKLLSVNVFSV